MTSPRPITRVESFDAFLSAARTCTEPVVYRLKDAELFPCHHKWSDDFLESVETSVGIHQATKPSFFDFTHSPLELARSAVLRETSVGDLVRTRKQPKKYWEMISGTDTHLCLESGPVPRWAKLWDDAKQIVDIVPAKLYRVGFWISSGRADSTQNLSSQMHWDVNGHHNLNFQVRGEKSVVMFAPSDGPYLYRMPSRLWHLSRVDPRKPNLQQHPLFAKAQPYVITLHERDVLLIPSGWWHHVTHKGELNVNLTYWYHSEWDSGKKWTWSSMLVPKPLEAWFYVAKLVSALLIILPPMLVYEKVSTSPDLFSKTKRLLPLLLSLGVLPVLAKLAMASNA